MAPGRRAVRHPSSLDVMGKSRKQGKIFFTTVFRDFLNCKLAIEKCKLQIEQPQALTPILLWQLTVFGLYFHYRLILNKIFTFSPKGTGMLISTIYR
jgi:hypothetical protein